MDDIDITDERDNINRRESKYPKCNHCGMFSQAVGLDCPSCGKGKVG